ncbi:MAG: spermidine synthase, partial [Bacteroidota bacterium]
HNQVLTLGEWGWIIAFKNIDKETVYSLIENTEFDQIETKWLDKEAVRMMMAFGKQPEASDSIINSLKKPIVHLYYTTGTWKLQ